MHNEKMFSQCADSHWAYHRLKWPCIYQAHDETGIPYLLNTWRKWKFTFTTRPLCLVEGAMGTHL